MTDQPDDLDAALESVMPSASSAAPPDALVSKAAARKAAAARARKSNMVNAPPPGKETGGSPSGFVDSMAETGQKITNYLKQGLGAAQDSTNAMINSSPTLSGVKRFFGDAGSALSQGVSNAPLVPQAMDSWKTLPSTMRDANNAIQR